MDDAFPLPNEACQILRDHAVRWEYRAIPLNEHPRSSDDIDVLCDAGKNRWELVTILPNNVAYLKRPLEDHDPERMTSNDRPESPGIATGR